MLKLYYLQGACPLVPHTALHWAKAEFEAVRLERGAQKQPEFLALNPQGSVPLLTDGDWTLAQNVAILDYLHEVYPQAQIFGSGDARQKAKARQWLALANSDLHGKFGWLFGAAHLLGDENAQNELRGNAIAAINQIYQQAEKVLQNQDYLCGDEITIADVYFYVTSRWANMFAWDWSDFAVLPDYFARVERNAGVQAALKEQGLA